MARKYVIGTEYLLISRKDYGAVPKLEGSFLTENEASAKRRELQDKDPNLVLKIETRTIFNTDNDNVRKEIVPARSKEPVLE